MKTFTKLLILVLFVTLNVAGIFPGTNQVKQAQASSYIDTGSATQSDYITLGSYYISKANVKAMAKNMRVATGGRSDKNFRRGRLCISESSRYGRYNDSRRTFCQRTVQD